ncbi:MAG: hypothetical protein IJC48_07250 [Clostridia bacterium]|nr:hypothetical protein [Clostridia bacterium]
MKNGNKKKKTDTKTLMVRAICIFLCVLLAGGSIASILIMLVNGYFY